MPGGPGEKVKIPIGSVLRAVDNKPVDGMNFDQVGMLVRGEPGSLVTLTIETEKEVTDYVLQRVSINAPTPAPTPTPTPTPTPAPQPGPNASLMRPGLRLSYSSEASFAPGARTPPVQDDNDQWIDAQTRQPVRVDANPVPGGSTIQQATLVAADAGQLVADLRAFFIADPQTKSTIQAQIGTLAGTPTGGLGEFWLPPQQLAQMPDGENGGYRFKRLRHTTPDGTAHDAISIKAQMPEGFQHNVYDLASGLLLASAKSQAQPMAGQQPGMQASVVVTQYRLINRREVSVPWASQTMPAWAKAGLKLEYAGSLEQGMGGGPPPAQVQCTFAIADAKPTVLTATQTVRVTGGPQQVPEQTTQRVFANYTLDPLYIDPQVLSQMQAGQVVDDDPATRRKVTFAGVENGQAVLQSESAAETSRYGYDPRTGALAWMTSQTKVAGMQSGINLRLTNPPAAGN